MSSVTMTISTFKNVAVRLPPWVSVLLRANHGVGKSRVVRQVIALLRKAVREGDSKICRIDMSKFKDVKEFLQVTDRRLSQMTEGDMVGLPSTDGETTRFNPPDWFKRACDGPVALFLDELNRATPEVMQAAFQIVLDRELNGWKLHPQTRVYAAINNSAMYTVNEMDPALLDRFFVVDLHPTLEEFVEWARNEDPEQGGALHPNIPDFISTQRKSTKGAKEGDGNWLYPPSDSQPGDVTPSPRSWEMVNNSLVYAGIMEHPEDPLFYPMVMGFVGMEAAIAFKDFCKNNDRRITGEELINEYHTDRIKSKVKRLGQSGQNDIVEKAADYVLREVSKLSDQQGKNINALMIDLPEELRISLWSKLTAQGIDKIDLAKSLHQHCAKLVLDVFGVTMGQAGIGMTPNIPGIFKTQSKDAQPGKR